MVMLDLEVVTVTLRQSSNWYSVRARPVLYILYIAQALGAGTCCQQPIIFESAKFDFEDCLFFDIVYI